jgi:sugar phosphate isomerase/epimerase
MSKIYVQPPNHYSFAEFLNFAEENRHNLEIATFAYANVLDNDWERILKEHKRQLSDFGGMVSLHGVFQDICVHSSDNKIAEVSKERILRNLEIASFLEAKYVVFHGSFSPLIRGERYINNWLERNADFWSGALKKYNVIVLLENLWEPTPEGFRRLLDQVGSPRLKICFDTGHANIFSKVPFKEWFDILNQDIPYVHVNDNKGEVDNELVPGDGIINWHEFTNILEDYQVNPEIVLEVGTLEKTKQSLRYLQMQNIYPFHVASARNSSS